MSGSSPGSTELQLPGPRRFWWAVAIVGICLPMGLLISRALPAKAPTAAAIDFESRKLNLIWRITTATLTSATSGDEVIDETPGTRATLFDENRAGHAEAIRELFERALEVQADASGAPTGASHAAAEVVVAHAIATGQDEVARKLSERLPTRSADLSAALAALASDANPTAQGEASDIAAATRFGRDWSRFTRDRIRARVHVAAGQLQRSREVHGRLHDNDQVVLTTARTLWFALVCAALFGLLSLTMWVVRGFAKPAEGQTRWGWLRDRYPGLGDARAYTSDRMAPVLGFAAWLVGYLLAGTLVAFMPGARAPGGLMVLFQSTAGVMLAWAVVSAFSTVNPAIDAARFLGGGEVGGWRASVAALWSYCALLPLMLPAILISDALGGGSPEGHPVVEMLVDGPEPIQLVALGLAVVVVTPIGEELLFRGFLYRVLRQHVGVGRALAITAGLFALLHMAPTQLLPYATLGLVFGLVFEWVGSLWAAIVLHGLWNAVVFAGIVLVALS